MSIDRLQEKIRKRKNPSVIDLTVNNRAITEYTFHQGGGTLTEAYELFAQEMMEGLRGIVPALRFNFNTFALLGADGLDVLRVVTQRAQKMGFYVLLDAPESWSSDAAEMAAEYLLNDETPYGFDALVVSSYIGSDGVKPYLKWIKQYDKGLFVVLRTANKSASELQDLLSGSRLVHMAMADIVSNLGAPLPARCGYSQVGGMAAATSADSLRALRSKYKNLFLLVDGCDQPGGNAKNCSYAFDALGHGAAVCAGLSVTAAWREDPGRGVEYVPQAVEAAERMKKNLSRYVTVL